MAPDDDGLLLPQADAGSRDSGRFVGGVKDRTRLLHSNRRRLRT